MPQHGQDEDEIAEIIEEVQEQCVTAAIAGNQKGTLVACMSGRSSDERASPNPGPTTRRRVESNDGNAAVSIKVVARVGYRYCYTGPSKDVIGEHEPHRALNGTPAAIHVEFGGVVARQSQPSPQHVEGHDARRLAVAVASCEAARSALSKRTFDGRQLLVVFALEPRQLR